MWDGEQFVGVGKGGVLVTSRDGSRWNQRPTGTMAALSAIAAGNGHYVAGGESGAVLVKEGAFGEFVCGARFTDVDGVHPGCYAIELLEAYRIVDGYPDGMFRPHQPVTRAEFAKLLVLTGGKQPDPRERVPFTDAQEHWAVSMGFIQPAVKMGAIQGFPDGLLRPDAELTRAQAVKIAVAAAGYHVEGQGDAYTDVEGSSWYVSYVATAVKMHLIGPEAKSALWDGPVFRGDEPVTRAEAAMLLANLRAVWQ
ncbi:MAG TPA: S-layer homology domain-containing protein, partial [Symbiobacteriaceae bacterium]|nr:S-layer homology domain-containing protein [Symbiobacteriaceae bacterium]